MSGADTGRTVHHAPFAGRRRRFRLALGQIAELERLCGTGIGAIMIRLQTHQFRGSDIREAIRLGLEGGGMSEPEATVLVMRYVDDAPLADHLVLAAEILNAAVSGVPVEPGKEEGERTGDPATSPPSTPPAPPSASDPTPSTA